VTQTALVVVLRYFWYLSESQVLPPQPQFGGTLLSVKLMTTTKVRLLLLAIFLFLALGQGCFAAEPTAPGAIWNVWNYERMSTDECTHWSTRALGEQGYSNVLNLENVAWGTKGLHSVLVVCWTPNALGIVVATNGDQAEAARMRDDLERRIHEIAHHREREHWH